MNLLRWIALRFESIDTRREQFVGYLDVPPTVSKQLFRLIGFEESDRTFGDEVSSWFLFEDQYMLHVMVYAGHPERGIRKQHAYVFAHMEPRVDEEPLQHLRRVDMSGPRGVNRVRTLFNKHGINYNNDSGIRN